MCLKKKTSTESFNKKFKKSSTLFFKSVEAKSIYVLPKKASTESFNKKFKKPSRVWKQSLFMCFKKKNFNRKLYQKIQKAFHTLLQECGRKIYLYASKSFSYKTSTKRLHLQNFNKKASPTKLQPKSFTYKVSTKKPHLQNFNQKSFTYKASTKKLHLQSFNQKASPIKFQQKSFTYLQLKNLTYKVQPKSFTYKTSTT